MNVAAPGRKTQHIDFEAIVTAPPLSGTLGNKGVEITLTVWISKSLRIIGITAENYPSLFAAIPDIRFDPDEKRLKHSVHIGGHRGLHKAKCSLARILNDSGIPTIIQ